MIPYFNGHLFNLPSGCLDLGGQPIYMFGVLVAIGVIVGDSIVVKEGAKRGLDPQDVKFLNVRIVDCGFVMAHLVSVIFYFPERIRENPLVLLYIWSGLSSFGGFLGAALAFLYYTRKEEIPRAALRRLGGAGAGRSAGSSGAPAASPRTITRAGTPTSSSRSTTRRRPRHDLGLDELLFTIVIDGRRSFVYARRPRVPGRIIGLSA